MSAPNSLGLELEVEKLQISDPVPAGAAADAPVTSETPAASEATTGETKADAPAVAEEPVATSPTEKKEEREKKPAPYVNHNRVLTGGAQREKLSDEALTEKMARIREQNEKIRQRKADVAADEDAWKKQQAVEAAKRERARKVQDDVNRARLQNAERKMSKLDGREWDAGKRERRPPGPSAEAGVASQSAPAGPNPATPSGDWARGGRGGGSGGGGGRGGRGRGRGRGASDAPSRDNTAPAAEATPAAATEK